MNRKYKSIYRKIKKFDTIVIARHVGADPDALGSSLGLKELILNTFPHKKVYAVGAPASRFRYVGELDRFTDEMYENSLLIITDTPDKKRVDGVDPDKFKYKIKIDHHPFIEKFCELEYIDEDASSASQLILELANKTRLKLNTSAAEKLFTGIVADTERFLYKNTQPKTFKLVSKLIKDTNLDFTSMYQKLYTRPFRDLKFQGYIANNMTLTENGLAYIKIDDEALKEYDIDASSARNMVSSFNYIDEIITWIILTNDKSSNTIRASIRSRGPIINEIASHFNGGGHIYASGARIDNEEDFMSLINELDNACKEYKDKA